MIHDYVREYISAINNPLPELASTFEAELEFLRGFIRDDSIILDVGCGAARPAVELAPFVKKIISIDNNQRMIDLATGRALGIKNIEIKKEDALKTSFEDGSFDVVYDTYNLIGSINYRDRQRLINEMTRVLKKEGTMINITWKDNNETTEFLKKYYPAIGIDILDINNTSSVTSKGTFDRFTKDQLKEFYESAGLSNIRFFDVGPIWMAIVGDKN